MPNVIDADGLQTKTQAELVEEFTLAMQDIYGADINLAPDTPDAQMMMIFIQATLDVLDLLTQIYNQFDPDNAIGVILDQRVAINGIQRQAGTFTVTPITVTTDRALNLYGLDQDVQEIYTVKDNSGNQFQLQESEVIATAGSYVLNFQAAEPGEVLTTPNTITLPVTIVLGVTAINNPSAYTTLGLNEESDADLRIRRQRSVSISSQGYLEGLIATLENIDGMGSVFVYENVTGSTDGDGVPSHSIWVIVSGSAADADIANAIYLKRNAGCGMKGDETYDITQIDGSIFTVKWDVVTTEDLYIEFDVSPLDGTSSIDVAGLKTYLVTNFVPGVFEQVNINDLATTCQLFDNNILVTGAGFSDAALGPFTPSLSPSSKDKQFTLDVANIDITEI